jgi:hypothetical protein
LNSVQIFIGTSQSTRGVRHAESALAREFSALPKFADYQSAFLFRNPVHTFRRQSSRNGRRGLIPAKIAPSGHVKCLDAYRRCRASQISISAANDVAPTSLRPRPRAARCSGCR